MDREVSKRVFKIKFVPRLEFAMGSTEVLKIDDVIPRWYFPHYWSFVRGIQRMNSFDVAVVVRMKEKWNN